MKIAYFTGLRQIELRDEPVPTLKRPGDVLVRIDRIGVCGSDVHYYVEGGIGEDRLRYPATLGHESAGTIVEVGSAVKNLAPGTKVVVEPALSCGNCDQCRAGRRHTCRNLQFMGCPGQAPGAAAQYMVVPAENAYPVPDSVTLDQAALAEPLSIGMYAFRLSGIQTGTKTAILGAGPIGLSVLLCAKSDVFDVGIPNDPRATANAPVPGGFAGFSSEEGFAGNTGLNKGTFYMTEPIAPRREMARQLGADWIGDPTSVDPVQAILEHEPLGLDTVFECSGDPACIDQALDLLGPGGRLVLVGIPPTVRVEFDIHRMRRKELTFINVRRQNECVAPVIERLADGRIQADAMITHRFSFEQIGDAFELVAGYRDGVVKAMLDLNQ